MLQTLAVTGPIYLIIALGYVAVRFDVLSKPDMRVLGTFVVDFALPALIFTALTQHPIEDVLDVRYVVDYAAGSLVVLLIAFGWGRWGQGKSAERSVLSGMGMACSNSGFVGYPIAAQVVGPAPAAVALALCMVVENLLMIPLVLVIADSGAASGERWTRVLARSLVDVLRKPLLLAIVAGVGVQLLRIPIFEPLTRTIGIVAASSTAVSLFVIGGSLVGLQTRGMRRDVAAIASGKLLLHPAAVAAMTWLLPPATPALRQAAIVFASMPMLGIYPILAQKYGLEGFSAAALLLTTIVSFVSINLVLSLLAWSP